MPTVNRYVCQKGGLNKKGTPSFERVSIVSQGHFALRSFEQTFTLMKQGVKWEEEGSSNISLKGLNGPTIGFLRTEYAKVLSAPPPPPLPLILLSLSEFSVPFKLCSTV